MAGDVAAEGASDVLAEVRGQDRDGAIGLLVRMQRRRSMEVYVQQGNGVPQQITDCNGSNCGQPALSPNGTLVAYIHEVTGAEHPN